MTSTMAMAMAMIGMLLLSGQQGIHGAGHGVRVQVHVCPRRGSDANSGLHAEAPLRSLVAARDAARKLHIAQAKADTDTISDIHTDTYTDTVVNVILHAGQYIRWWPAFSVGSGLRSLSVVYRNINPIHVNIFDLHVRRAGVHHLVDPLVLDSRDSHTNYLAVAAAGTGEGAGEGSVLVSGGVRVNASAVSPRPGHPGQFQASPPFNSTSCLSVPHLSFMVYQNAPFITGQKYRPVC